MKPIYKRKIGACIILSIITFGIYLVYWGYMLLKNIRILENDETSCRRELLCLIFVPFYSLFWWYTKGIKVKELLEKENRRSAGNGIVYLILGILGLRIVSMAIMQNDFNSLSRESIDFNKKIVLVWFLTSLIILAIITVFYFIFRGINSGLTKSTYPVKDEFSDFVDEYSEIFGVPKSMIWAVIKVESKFDPKAASDANAKGLMQITENTRAEIQNKITSFELENLNGKIIFNPETNIKFGIFYLSKLTEKYGDGEVALAAYCFGESRIDKYAAETDCVSFKISDIKDSTIADRVAEIKRTEADPELADGFNDEFYSLFIRKYSEYYGVNRNTVYAVIKTMGGSVEEKTAEHGGKGLMSLSPEALDKIRTSYTASAVSAPSQKILFDPETNIKYGTLYLAQLYKQYGNWNVAIAAYYAGRSSISKWIKENNIINEDTGELVIENIPDENTRNFVNRVIAENVPFSTTDEKEKQYSDLAEGFSLANRIPKTLIRAMICVESGFDQYAVSEYGAKGLMQLTDRELLEIMKENESGELLFDPETNIKYGTFYLMTLFKRFGSWETALAAYNAGPTRVKVWLSDPILVDGEGRLIVDKIPFPETRNYVKNVLEIANNYIENYYPEEDLGPEDPADTTDDQ